MYLSNFCTIFFTFPFKSMSDNRTLGRFSVYVFLMETGQDVNKYNSKCFIFSNIF